MHLALLRLGYAFFAHVFPRYVSLWKPTTKPGTECSERWFPGPGQRKHSHVPFRDKASQEHMKPVARGGASRVAQDKKFVPERGEPDRSLPEPEEEKEEEELAGPAAEHVPVFLPPEERPTLEDYRAKWAEKLAWHSRVARGRFSDSNLVPRPIPQLWQDCPHVPFDALKSAEAQSRLSVCKPHCGLEQASCHEGVPRYAHNTGDAQTC